MPDNDIVPRGVRKPWRAAAELAIGGHPVDQVADACGKALAEEIRDSGLSDPAVRLSRELEAAVASGRLDSFSDAAFRFRMSMGESPVAAAVLVECERVLETGSASRTATDDGPAQALLEGALCRLASGALFGSQRMLSKMHQESGMSVVELSKYQSQIVASIQTPKLARAIVAQPEAGVRAPQRTARASTAEMLEEEVS